MSDPTEEPDDSEKRRLRAVRDGQALVRWASKDLGHAALHLSRLLRAEFPDMEGEVEDAEKDVACAIRKYDAACEFMKAAWDA